MDASKQSPLSSFKSKKVLRSPAPPSDRKVSDQAPDPLSVKTPGKPADQPRRSRIRSVVMSIADVRKAAMKLREQRSDPPPRSDPVSPSEEEAAEPEEKPAAGLELPENYELLERFFISLDSSIRLLQMKRSATTFSKISPQIETLTDRRFTYSHLAQLKFIMPDAIVLEKVLEHDERTSCMKPVLRITLDAESIKSKCKSQSLSANLQLRKVFRSRLVKFFKSHPEADEVPEEVLPAPFDRLNEGPSMNSILPLKPSFSQQNSGHQVEKPKQKQPFVGFHLPPSFKRGFSQRNCGDLMEKLKQEQPFISDPLPSFSSENTFSGGSPHKGIIRGSSSKPCSSYEASLGSKTAFTFPETPVKCVNSVEDEDQCCDEMASQLKTPVAMASTPTSATPMLQPTKRSYMSPDNDSCRTPNKLVRRPPPNRPLKFDTPKKSVTNDDEDGKRVSSSTHGDIFNILPQSLIQSIQEKERLASLEKDPAISQAMRRRKMIAGLPKLFDRIYFFFQSIKRSVVTKEELIHRLITQLDVVARIDVEEQLRLLQELAPEWIHEKLGLSGDLLLCVNKISSAEAMRTRLSEAI